MVVLGADSDSAKAYVDYVLSVGERYEEIYLISPDKEEVEKLALHYYAKYEQKCKPIFSDLTKEDDYSFLDNLEYEKIFCTTGFLGRPILEGLYDLEDASRIVKINYSNLILLLNKAVKKLEEKGRGDVIIFSSVAGDRGRQSNFIYGSAKAAMTAYASGLRNYMAKKGIHVLTVKPGFMNTTMTVGLDFPKLLTAQPKQVAKIVYNAYKSKKNTVYVLWMWRYIMLIIKNIPEFIFKKLSL